LGPFSTIGRYSHLSVTQLITLHGYIVAPMGESQDYYNLFRQLAEEEKCEDWGTKVQYLAKRQL
jgi:hypothetical protein